MPAPPPLPSQPSGSPFKSFNASEKPSVPPVQAGGGTPPPLNIKLGESPNPPMQVQPATPPVPPPPSFAQRQPGSQPPPVAPMMKQGGGAPPIEKKPVEPSPPALPIRENAPSAVRPLEIEREPAIGGPPAADLRFTSISSPPKEETEPPKADLPPPLPKPAKENPPSMNLMKPATPLSTPPASPPPMAKPPMPPLSSSPPSSPPAKPPVQTEMNMGMAQQQPPPLVSQPPGEISPARGDMGKQKPSVPINAQQLQTQSSLGKRKESVAAQKTGTRINVESDQMTSFLAIVAVITALVSVSVLAGGFFDVF